jgi:hypothetical protein
MVEFLQIFIYDLENLYDKIIFNGKNIDIKVLFNLLYIKKILICLKNNGENSNVKIIQKFKKYEFEEINRKNYNKESVKKKKKYIENHIIKYRRQIINRIKKEIDEFKIHIDDATFQGLYRISLDREEKISLINPRINYEQLIDLATSILRISKSNSSYIERERADFVINFLEKFKLE